MADFVDICRMRMLRVILLSSFLMSAFAGIAQVENTSKQIVVLLFYDDSQVIGPVVDETDATITVLFRQEERLYSKSKIREIVEAKPEQIVKGTYVYATPNPNGYLVTPTAYTLGKSNIAIQSNYFLYHELQVGIKEHLDLSIGTSLIGTPVGVSVKQHLEALPTLNLGLEGNVVWGSWIDPNLLLFGGQVILTNGDRERNFTFSPGIGGVVRNGKLTGMLYSTFGGKARLSEMFTLTGEGLYARELGARSLSGVFHVAIGVQHHRSEYNSWGLEIGAAGLDQYNYPLNGVPQQNPTVLPMIHISYRKLFH